MPTALRLRCHSSSYWRKSADVAEIAPAVAVAVDVAEFVEQRPGSRWIVSLAVLDVGVVAGDVGRNRLRGRLALALADDANLFVDVVRHGDRAAQRDFFLAVAADDRIFHVEIGVRDRGLHTPLEYDPLLR